MTAPEESIADTEPTIRPTVLVSGVVLPEVLSARLMRVVVDNDMHLPGMFELTFVDMTGQTMAEAGIEIGTLITVSAMGQGATPTVLITGEVTAIEGQVQGVSMRTVARGYTGAHRLQRARRSRSFINVTDADVANQIAGEAGLSIGQVVATSTTYPYLAQVNETDWEFLTTRAREIGFETGVANGQFYFRPGVDSLISAGAGVEGYLRSVEAGVAGLSEAVPVRFPDDLISFRPRLSAGNLTPDVEVRVWDPMSRTAAAQTSPTPVGEGPCPMGLGAQFTSGGLISGLSGAIDTMQGSVTSLSGSGITAGMDAAENAVQDAASQLTGGVLGSPIGFLGAPPSPTAHIVVDRPVADSTTMETAGPLAARTVGTDFGSTFAECEGESRGNAAIQPNTKIEIQGVQTIFAGKWQVSRARHIFDDSEYGYRVVFSAHGRQDRTMVGLSANAGRRPARNPVLNGVVCGVVSDCADPLGKGRVKVTLPWLSPTFSTDWAPNIQFCSGPRSGAIFMPEIGDEVLVAFEFGDVRRPYVLGAMMNNHTQWSIAQSGPIFAGGLAGLGTAAVGMAAQAAGAALLAPLGPAGTMAGAAIGTQVGNEINNELVQAASGATIVPGMVSEVHHRGFVSSTGNALLFYDVPMIPPLPTAADVGSVTGESIDAGGGTDSTSFDVVPPTAGAMASAVRLGAQDGSTGLTIDQVNGGVNLTATLALGGAATTPPNINISAADGFVNIGAGEAGTMLIDGGLNLIIKSSVAITLEAPAINLMGIPFVNGVPIPI